MPLLHRMARGERAKGGREEEKGERDLMGRRVWHHRVGKPYIYIVDRLRHPNTWKESGRLKKAPG